MQTEQPTTQNAPAAPQAPTPKPVETAEEKFLRKQGPKFRIKDFQPWQVKRLVAVLGIVLVVMVSFLVFATTTLYQDKMAEDTYWNNHLTQDAQEIAAAQAKSANATVVSVGSYIESIKEMNLKTSSFRVMAQIWFRWSGNDTIDMKDAFHVYNGTINKTDVICDDVVNGEHYQLLRCDITVGKEYWTVRFPLESHQLRFYVESEYPIEQVTFVADAANSGVNENLSAPGFAFKRSAVSVYYQDYASTHGDPKLLEPITTAEFVTAMEFNRSSWGLYVKCFVALVGTLTWVMIALFLGTFHHVDPLNLIPAALFGTVTNIMVGANLLPDALQMGLLEFVNAWGIMVILSVTLSIININRIRNKYEDKAFAKFFGRIMFFTILTLNITGHILLPLCAYAF